MLPVTKDMTSAVTHSYFAIINVYFLLIFVHSFKDIGGSNESEKDIFFFVFLQ